jgi:hypothetical protein
LAGNSRSELYERFYHVTDLSPTVGSKRGSTAPASSLLRVKLFRSDNECLLDRWFKDGMAPLTAWRFSPVPHLAPRPFVHLKQESRALEVNREIDDSREQRSEISECVNSVSRGSKLCLLGRNTLPLFQIFISPFQNTFIPKR